MPGQPFFVENLTALQSDVMLMGEMGGGIVIFMYSDSCCTITDGAKKQIGFWFAY